MTYILFLQEDSNVRQYTKENFELENFELSIKEFIQKINLMKNF